MTKQPVLEERDRTYCFCCPTRKGCVSARFKGAIGGMLGAINPLSLFMKKDEKDPWIVELAKPIAKI